MANWIWDLCFYLFYLPVSLTTAEKFLKISDSILAGYYKCLDKADLISDIWYLISQLSIFVSQIRAMWEEQTIVPLWTGPAGKQDLLPAISVPWSRKEAILVPTRPDPSMPVWRCGRGMGWATLTSFWDASYVLPGAMTRGIEWEGGTK